ncbi:hypothetical protein PMAYCL1PPCAC_12989, partial [Pristionchus mayeri]
MDVRAVGATRASSNVGRAIEVSSSNRSREMALMPTPIPIESGFDRLIGELMHLELSHQKLRRSQYNPSFPPPQSLEWCLLGPSRMGIDFGEMPITFPPHQPPIPFVTMEDRLRYRIDFPADPDYVPPSTFKMWITVDLVYTIEWLKTLPFLHRLSDYEKIRLVSNVTQAVAYLTVAFDSFSERNSDVTIMPDGTVLFQGNQLRENSVEHNKWFGIISRLKELRVDKREYVLIKTIMACDPGE